MVNVTDRVPQNPNQFELTDGGTVKTVTIVRDDNPVQAGTMINRELLMGVQGFIGGTVTFETNGNIVEVNSTGTLTTVFLENGNIQQTFVGTDGQTISKLTSFGADGNISEVIS